MARVEVDSLATLASLQLQQHPPRGTEYGIGMDLHLGVDRSKSSRAFLFLLQL